MAGANPRLTPLELRIMEALWTRGPSSVREIHDTFTERRRPAFTTVQTIVYRLERKGAVRCVRRISNANIFEAAISRDAAEGRLVDELLAALGGSTRPLMAHLVRSGKLTMRDVKEAEQLLRSLSDRKKSQ
jgi:predicted transcriptional regulator